MIVRHRWLSLGFVVLVLAVATHWPVRKGFFQTDDFIWLHLANWRSVAESFVGNQGSNLAYRPIFRLSTYLDVLVFGRNAAAWHFENVVWHASNALLLAALLRAYRLPFSLASGAAILFVLAPLSGESVNWISGRGSLLCFTFMLLSLWRWTVALHDGRRPWAALFWMVLAGMTYEAAIALPAVLVCLTPLACRRFALDPWLAARQAGLAIGTFVGFWLVRSAFLGTLTGEVGSANSDLAGNFLSHMQALGVFAQLLAGKGSLLLLSAATAICLLSPRLRPAGAALLLIAVILMLPYSTVIGIGGRYFYMLQAPVCVIAVLPALLVPKSAGGPTIVLLLALVLPKFAASDLHEAFSFTRAGTSTEALIGAVLKAIPSNDGASNVVDNVPDFDNGQMMMGDFFELCIGDFYEAAPAPWIARTEAVLRNKTVLHDVLSRPAHFWQYDPETRSLLPLDRRAWLEAHPETL